MRELARRVDTISWIDRYFIVDYVCHLTMIDRSGEGDERKIHEQWAAGSRNQSTKRIRVDSTIPGLRKYSRNTETPVGVGWEGSMSVYCRTALRLHVTRTVAPPTEFGSRKKAK